MKAKNMPVDICHTYTRYNQIPPVMMRLYDEFAILL